MQKTCLKKLWLSFVCEFNYYHSDTIATILNIPILFVTQPIRTGIFTLLINGLFISGFWLAWQLDGQKRGIDYANACAMGCIFFTLLYICTASAENEKFWRFRLKRYEKAKKKYDAMVLYAKRHRWGK